ncbi:VWA domain-containing protein [Nodosilinea sp. LEGE 07088]|uniref:VWA domain-containing protein n=1 Tax=Nodosilinea sp. LEGE 07088 TaxID=2777968 RepID=UPI0018824342|nr:VWA domain-containing protein [Nodosilinea sp. LEGE 07088]MBE9140261.1 VWA domain-containing protein [Nodosilinea sp. LEGE 07088]
MADVDPVVRWRHVLGRFAEAQLPCQMTTTQQRIEQALDFLYGQEYCGRGVRGPGGSSAGVGSPPDSSTEKQPGSLDPSQMSVPTWITEIRELFPQETVEIIEKHALDRYGLTELVTDPATLEKLEPNMELLKAVLTFRSQMQGQDVLDAARRIVREVVEAIRQRLETDIRRSLIGKLNRFRHSPLKVAQNLDWRGTLRQNLKHYDRDRRRLIVQTVRFFSRVERRLPWHVILCIDQSGSMANSVIHSAVMGGILAGLPSLKVSFVVFDTSVVDLTEHADDPVELLMSVQLGGGTNIGQALSYCQSLVHNPLRTVLVLISDFAEGASPQVLLTCCDQLCESGVTLLGLASLEDQQATAYYDVGMAEQLATHGMEIAALTPRRLAEWLAQKIS